MLDLKHVHIRDSIQAEMMIAKFFTQSTEKIWKPCYFNKQAVSCHIGSACLSLVDFRHAYWASAHIFLLLCRPFQVGTRAIHIQDHSPVQVLHYP